MSNGGKYVEELENYSIAFDAQHYKTNRFNIFFNVSTTDVNGGGIERSHGE